MKIWIDILDPGQLLFFEQIIKGLEGHEILCTSRRYGEITGLARIRKIRPFYAGRFGGKSKEGKLKASIHRMGRLVSKVEEFGPEVAISFCSPEAARISFGLGIRHVVFADTPYAHAILRLTCPLIQRLLTPYIIPKRLFTVHGLAPKDIIHYRGLTSSVTAKRTSVPHKLPFARNGKKNILVRPDEEEAAYASVTNTTEMIKQIVKKFDGENVVVLGRYPDQIARIKKIVGGGALVVPMSSDGKYLLEHTDVFIGSGGTMTSESALLGVPTVSYNAVPNHVEKFLVKRRLAIREMDPKSIGDVVEGMLESGGVPDRAKKILAGMEDPIEKLRKTIEVG